MQAFLDKLGPYIWQAAAVIVVIALLLVAWTILRRVFNGRIRASGGGRARQPRLGVVDAFDLDRERQLILVRRDNVEHLVMIGGPNDVLIESAIIRAGVQAAEGRGRGGPSADDNQPGLAPPPAPTPPPYVPAPPAPAPAEPAPTRAPAVFATPEPPAPTRRPPPSPRPPPLFSRDAPPSPAKAPDAPVVPPVMVPEPAAKPEPGTPLDQFAAPTPVEQSTPAPIAPPPPPADSARARFDFAKLASRSAVPRPMTTPVAPRPTPPAPVPPPAVEAPIVESAPRPAAAAPAPAIEPPAPPPMEPPAEARATGSDDGLLELEAEMAKLLGRPGEGGKP